jgi:hypothetical protein
VVLRQSTGNRRLRTVECKTPTKWQGADNFGTRFFLWDQVREVCILRVNKDGVFKGDVFRR